MISQAEAEHLRMEEESQMEVVAQQRAGVEQVRLETEAQIRRLEEERAELEAAVEARQAEAERLRMEAESQMEVVAQERAAVEQVRLETEAQIRRLAEERAKLEAAVEARQTEAERLRMEAERQISEAENRSRAEQEQFLLPTADLERVTEEVAHRRAAVEASLHANEEDRRLLEMQQATEQSRQPSSAELLWLEPEICQRTGTDHGLLEETGMRTDPQQLIEEEAQRHAEVEEQQLAELDALRQTHEAQLINEVNNLHAEHLRDEAQEHYRYGVEELERISFEAQGQAIQEEQMPGKLEDIPRQLVVATQATAQLSDLPEEEVEKLRSLEWEQEELAGERKSVAVRSSR